MFHRRLAGIVVVVCLLTHARPAAAQADAALLRVFLKDGSALVSYGEFARVGDRVVFSMPTASGPNPPLQLVNIADGQVDWERTNSYAESVRATRYLETQADADYARLSNAVAEALRNVALLTDATQRLQLAEATRKMLSEWPQNHFNHRMEEVRQLLALLDEAIADLRAATGGQQFDLSLATFVGRPAPLAPPLPPPTPKEAVEQILTAARAVDSSTERTRLLSAALVAVERDPSLPREFVNAVRTEVQGSVRAERQTDRAYKSLTDRIMALVSRRVRVADVRGIERLAGRARRADEVLGRKRPESIQALLAAIDGKLDAARQLQLARDRYALRAPVLRAYQRDIGPSLDLLVRVRPSLENIKALAGTPPQMLLTLQRNMAAVSAALARVAPPDEVRTPHALLVSAAQLAGNAGEIRREALLNADMQRAWDASSAAAGALMLIARGRTDMVAQVNPPKLPR